MGSRGQSSKRHPSKRVITARKEMRTVHLLHEYDEDDHDWSRERKHNILNAHSPNLLAHNHGYKHAKLKNRRANKNNQEYY